jgi:RNA polymerase sigma factor (sigma-70 family)
MRSLGAEAVETGGETEAEPGLELEQLYRSYAGTLVARLRRRFGAEAAEDIVQEAFIKIGRYSATAPVRSPKALITRIAINLGLDQARGRTDRLTVELDTLETRTEGCIAAEQLETLLLKQIILQLPYPLQDVFILQRFGGMTYAEIAKHCGVSVKTVEWRMSKALAFCTARMRE